MYDLTATWPVPSEIHKGALMEHKKSAEYKDMQTGGEETYWRRAGKGAGLLCTAQFVKTREEKQQSWR